MSDQGYSDRVPRRAYARIDAVDLEDLDEIVIGLDAVSAEGVGSLLAIRAPDDWDAVWRDLLSGGQSADRLRLIETFDGLELVHIEVKTNRDLAGQILSPGALGGAANGWLALVLAPGHSADGVPVTVFTGLFAPGLPATLLEVGPATGRSLAVLQAAFSTQTWPIAPDDALERVFEGAGASTWAAYDVGQGSANALLGSGGVVDLLHDIGCGVYANAKTRPFGRVLCSSRPAPIVLSHWDTDHWAGARYLAPPRDPEVFLRRDWIVPSDATIGPRHVTFAVHILAAGGRLLVVGPAPWQSPWMSLADGRRARLTRGNGADRNSMGIVLDVHDAQRSDGRWLLTGDVDYRFVQASLAPNYVAMSVPHHGAKQAKNSACPGPAQVNGYARLVYSFGQDNSYGHPNAACLDAHVAAGWDHGKWYPSNQAVLVAGGHVVATACNTAGPGHLGSIEIGWTHAPLAPRSASCGGGKCNATIGQS